MGQKMDIEDKGDEVVTLIVVTLIVVFQPGV